MVDDACWEPRQPQDFLRAVKETSNTLPWTRPDPEHGAVPYILNPPNQLYVDADYYVDYYS